MKNSNNNGKNFFSSFGNAINGLRLIVRYERNFRVFLVVAFLVVMLGFFFKISYIDWIAINLVISMVLISEAINSAVEALCDTVSDEYRMKIKYVKDVTAGAVLVSSVVSFITGLIIFIPYIVEFVGY